MSKNKQIAEEVVKKIGGAPNISNAWHCVTRLRFTLVKQEIVELDEIKKIPGVMSAQFSGNQFQVIIGNSVAEVFTEVEKLLSPSSNQVEALPEDNQKFMAKLFDIITGIFIPIMPVLAGTGLIKGFLALAVLMGIVSDQSQTYLLISGLADTVFHFMPLFLAISTARKFKVSEYLALTLAASMMYPTFLNAANESVMATFTGEVVLPWKLFGFFNVPLVSYASSVIPIIFGVILLKYVSQWIKKWMPNSLTMMMTPMLSLIIVFPIMLVVIGPAGDYLGQTLGNGIGWLFETAGPLAGLVIGAAYPLLVMTGMHYAFIPISVVNFTMKGYENTITPVIPMSVIAQAGATFGVAIRTKNSEMRQLAISSGITALLGITEPAMYGVTMKLKKPFYYSVIGGGLAGIFVNIMKTKAYGGAGIGLLMTPAFINDKDPLNVVWFLLGLLISFSTTFLLTLILGFDDEPTSEPLVTTQSEEKNTSVSKKSLTEQQRVYAPLNGILLPLKDVPDETFSSELMGRGIAIQATDNNLYAPITGEVVIVTESQHAIGIRSPEGLEVLIHVGIDTVELKGDGFNLALEKGQKVEKGQLLGTVDFDLLKSKDYEVMTVIIITNTKDYFEVEPIREDGPILVEDELLIII